MNGQSFEQNYEHVHQVRMKLPAFFGEINAYIFYI